MRTPRPNESRLRRRPRSIAALLATGALLAVAWAGGSPHPAAATWEAGVVDLLDEADVQMTGAGVYWAGHSVSSAGDVNGDGHDDVIVGAPLADPRGRADAGAAYVVFGKRPDDPFAPIDLTALGTQGFRIDGAEGDPDGSTGLLPGDQAGISVSAAGDVNGDGFDDVIVGAPYGDPSGRTDAGAAYVVFGGASTTLVDLAAIGQPDNQDGFRIDGVAGTTDPYYSAEDYCSTPWRTSKCGDQAGVSVSSAGDVNGDSFDDVVVCANHADPQPDRKGPIAPRSDAGSAYVVFGRASTTSVDLAKLGTPQGDPGFRIDGAAVGDAAYPGDKAGYSVAGAGDVNGDRFDDVIVSAFHADPLGRANAGSAYVVFGKSTTGTVDLATLGSQGFRMVGAVLGEKAGNWVSGAGDVSGDGLDDVIIGAQHGWPAARQMAGRAYVVFGKTATTEVDLETFSGTTSQGFRIDGAAGIEDGPAGRTTGDNAGRSVAGVGDVNGDGWNDIMVGAYFAAPAERIDAGSAYVIFRKDPGDPTLTAPIDLAHLDLGSQGIRIDGAVGDPDGPKLPDGTGLLKGDSAGTSVAAAGDVNGDGGLDVLVGAPFWAPGDGRQEYGAAYIIFGEPPPVPLPPEPQPSPPAPEPSPTPAPQPFDAGTPVVGPSQPRLGAFSIRLRCASSAGKQGGREAVRLTRCARLKPRTPALEVRFTSNAPAKVILRVTQRVKSGKGKRRRTVERTVLSRTLDAGAGSKRLVLKVSSKVASSAAGLTGKLSVVGGEAVLKAPVRR